MIPLLASSSPNEGLILAFVWGVVAGVLLQAWSARALK